MKTIVLNHKMNLYYENLDNYINRINQIKQDLIIAPSNIYLLEFKKKCHHKIASQDLCYIEDGNYTSKVSWHQIKSLGIAYSIIGHSEKEEDFSKTNTKLKTCLENGIKPILCINSIKDMESLLFQVKTIDDILFAYEPIKNINRIEIDIQKIKLEIDEIYKYLLNKYHTHPTLLYGGGITEKNIQEIYNIDALEGILIGSISADIDALENILSLINEK